MIALDLRNPGLRDIFRLSVRRTHAYRIFTFLGVLQVFLQLLLLRAIWQAVYGDQESVDGVSIQTTISYLTVVGLINFIIYPGIAREIHRRIDQGQIAVDMVRPVGFVRQMIALELGDAAGRWMLLIVVIPGLVLIGSLAPPPPAVLAVFLLSVFLAFVVSVLIWLMVGLSSIWLLNIEGIRSMIGILGSFLAGSMIPLWFMPGPLRVVVEVLPFQAITFLPASIYVGEAAGWQMWRAIAIQAVWVVILALLAAWVWRRAQHRLVVQGG